MLCKPVNQNMIQLFFIMGDSFLKLVNSKKRKSVKDFLQA